MLSLCLAKFHLFLLPIGWLVATGRWRAISGLALGFAGLFAVSVAAEGIAWPVHYLNTLRRPQINPEVAAMPNLNGFGSVLGAPGWVELVLALAVVLLALACVLRGRTTEGVAATLLAGLLTSHHAYLQDAALVLPAILPLLPPGKLARDASVIRLLLLTPLPYLACFLPRIGGALVVILVVVELLQLARAEKSASDRARGGSLR